MQKQFQFAYQLINKKIVENDFVPTTVKTFDKFLKNSFVFSRSWIRIVKQLEIILPDIIRDIYIVKLKYRLYYLNKQIVIY